MCGIGNIEYFFWLWFKDTVHSFTLVSVFSPPDQSILELSHGTAYICYCGSPEMLTIMAVKAINAFVAMVPNYQVTIEGNIIIPENRFLLVKLPFLKLATLCRTFGEDNNAIDDAINIVI
jgi:hypothetical protein